MLKKWNFLCSVATIVRKFVGKGTQKNSFAQYLMWCNLM